MFIVDRIEENNAVIEWEKKTFHMPLEILPEEVKEGDCLNIDINIDLEKTKDRKGKIKEKAKKLWD